MPDALTVSPALDREFTRLHGGRRTFAPGQLWRPRKLSHYTSAPDLYRIEAITDHPRSPVLARHLPTDVICAYGLDGHEDGRSRECDADLIEMVSV